MKDNFQELNCEHDVINLGNAQEKFFVDIPMFKLEELAKLIKLKLLHISQGDWEKKQHEDWLKARKEWLDEGKDCEVLRLGSTKWQKGKIKIKVSLEFCPDEPDIKEPLSELDAIRRSINQNN